MRRFIAILILGAALSIPWWAVACRKHGSQSGRDAKEGEALPVKVVFQYTLTFPGMDGRFFWAKDLAGRSAEELKTVLPEMRKAAKDKKVHAGIRKIIAAAIEKAEGGGGAGK